MKNIVVVGSQWGDEGKGKITDYLAQNADVVVRYQGGNNAGHTVVINNEKYALHLLPSGILNKNIKNIMANGMVINPKAFYEELSKIKNEYQLFVSDRAHIVLPAHIEMDKLNEKTDGIGTTNRGIGPAYTDKAARTGMRVSSFINKEKREQKIRQIVEQKNKILISKGKEALDIDAIISEYEKYAEYMKPFVADTSYLLNELIHDHKVLFEGAQGVMLCLDHGTYPYVTSSSPTAASVPLNTGIAPWYVKGAIGVTKAYTTRVGSGPFPSEMFDELAQYIRETGREYGTSTGRPRRIGWLDTVVINYSKRVSGLSYLAVTLLDVLSKIKELKIVVSYNLDGKEIFNVPSDYEDFLRCEPNFITLPGWDEDITQVKSFEELPLNAQKYIEKIEELTGIKVAIFSVGPDRNQTIQRFPIL
ncbi:adenylosuccinate synthase [Acholeplasma hippikon]|uniref:Adenylosuccinate synthetase n=1 Tax=Acholeplasma hippikon TaxID=264636 RepID=A0A449BKL4_9MOLU|nr:adenylosuccinate synthase [Acholeplasma hippikon]VEU83016.1 Adenylosuccinate synthetase [Acholeplasma hippikon]